jgi:transposase
MPKPYSDDLRERVIEAVEAGVSRREAAESFKLSPSSAVKWLQRWRNTGSAKAKPSGGSTSPLEEHAEWMLAVVAEQPDLTLDEIVAAIRLAVFCPTWSHLQKKPARRGATTAGRGPRTPSLAAREVHV